MNPTIHNITFKLLEDAYHTFKKRFPREEPHIRVICSRHYKFISGDVRLNSSWRKVFIDEKHKWSEPITLDQSVTTQKIEINQSEKPLLQVKQNTSKNRIIEINTRRQEKRENIIEEREIIKPIDKTIYSADVIIDSRTREYDGSIIIKNGVNLNISHIESINKIENSCLVINKELNDIDCETILDLFNETQNYIKDLKNQLEALKISLNVTNYITFPTIKEDCVITPTIKESKGVDKGVMVNLGRTGKELWTIVKKIFKTNTMRKKLLINSINRIKTQKIVTNHYEGIIKHNQETIDTLNSKLEVLVNSLSKTNELSEKIKKTIAGNKTIEDICNSYFTNQKKLNDLKSRISPILFKHTNLKWESKIKEFGFINSIYHAIKYFDQDYDSEDSVFDDGG